MIIVYEQAEEKLLQTLNNLKVAGGQPRCIHIEWEYASRHVESLLDLIAKHINDPDAQIFICENSSLFVVGHGITLKNSAALYEVIAHFAQDEIPAGKEFLTVFDVRANWLTLIGLVERKLEEKKTSVRLALEKAQKLRQEAERQRVLSMSFDEALVRSIPQRRQRRDRKVALTVEDDFFTRTLIMTTVGKGLVTLPAASGEEAIKNYVMEAPDIVFLDIGLPDVSGYDVLAAILKLDPTAFVVMLSGGGSKENIMQSMATGAKGFIVKPFTKEKIMQYINKCPDYRQEKTGGAT